MLYTIYDPMSGLQVPPELIPKDDRHAGGLPKCISLSVKTRVMLLCNLCTNQGLINGAMGIVTSLDFHANTLATVYVKFDDHIIGTQFQDDRYSGSIPIRVISQEFFYKGRYIDRTTFPLIPSWACTVHKTQGLSLDHAVISLGKSLFQAGQAYVALSRVRSLSGVYILNIAPDKFYSDPKVLAEYQNILDQNNHH